MRFDCEVLVNEPNMSNCLERLLYETIADKQMFEKCPIADLVLNYNLNPNYIFRSQYAIAKKVYGKPLLYVAVIFDRADLVKLLLHHERGASPNCVRDIYANESPNEDSFRRTVIFQSLCVSSAEVFDILLRAPVFCDAFAVDAQKCSLLWHAVSMSKNDKVFSLVHSRFGSELVEKSDVHGTRPLHVAALNNNVFAAEILLNAGARIDSLQHELCSAVCIAANRGAIAVLKALLMHGADPNFLPSHDMIFHPSLTSEAALKCYNKNRSNMEMKCPIAMALLPAMPFRKSADQIMQALSILHTCGAQIPRAVAQSPLLTPSMLKQFNRPLHLQLLCALTIRRRLVAHNGHRSIKLLHRQLVELLPESLVQYLYFDFLA